MKQEPQDEFRTELRSYVVGLMSAAILTAVAFVLVAAHAMARTDIIWAIAVLAMIQIVCHFRYFLHIDLSRSKRDDLQLILFSALIVVLMVGGTIWIIGNQHARMM